MGALGADNVRDAVDGDADDAKGEGEEQDQLELAGQAHLGADNHRDGEENEEKVGNDIADGHGEELDVALAALTSRVRKNSRVHAEGPAFDDVGDDDGDEGGDEGDFDEGKR